jgi:endopeptidase La
MEKKHIDIFVFLIKKYRLHKKIIKKMNGELKEIFDNIQNIMKTIHSHFKNDILDQHNYNTNINTLEEILDKFKVLPNPLKLQNLKTLNYKKIRDILNHIRNEIKNVCKMSGGYTIKDTIHILINKNINTEDKLTQFLNNTFRPTKCTIYDKNSKSIEKSLIVYNKNKNQNETQTDEQTKEETEIDYEDIHKINTIKFKSLDKNPMAMIEHINGIRIYLPVILKKATLIFILDGYVLEDPLNISRVGGSIGKKNSEVISFLQNININENFKQGYIEQLSLRDFLIYNPSEITDKIVKAYQEVDIIRGKTISIIIKDFLNKSVEEQRYMITLLLLMKDDIEIQYLAYLMYDMISNESYLLKPQPLAEQVFNSLHWSVQKIFKTAIKKVNQYSKNIVDFNEENIPYEKRIILMKVPENVKLKALEKYKEIINKGGESSSKSQQYLDGLLRIPFGIYKKEKIIRFLEDFTLDIEPFIIQIKNYLNTNDNPIIDTFYNKYSVLLSDKIKSNEIRDLIEEFSKINKFFTNTDPIFIKNKIDIFSKENKVGHIKAIIEKLNKMFNFNIPISKKRDMIKYLETKMIKSDLNISRSCLCILQNLHYIHDSKNYDKLNKQFDNIEHIWTSYRKDSQEYIKNAKDILNKAIYSQHDAKKEIERIIAQWINGEMKGYCFGFEGPPGTGKTTLAKKGISQCLKDENGKPREFSFIAIGGSSNASTLEGHSYTYVGSTWGKIVDILLETKCMNPIIYIDELDKISNTENGKEIIGILTHLTDTSQNDQFNDKYFSGINIDLSKVLFIFSYNDYSLLDPILADRIHRIKFNHLSKKEKIHIIENYILPEILDMVGFNSSSILFDKGVVEYIIINYTYEAGVRKLKETIFEIVREINLNYVTDNEKYTFPITIGLNEVKDIFSKKAKILEKKIAIKPQIGLVNGLFATSVGVGGLTIIETFRTISDSKLSLVLTGQQGDVMQESVKCAKTIAWNIIPNEIKKEILESKESFGIHVHCPEAATPKDGPSAGGAITLAIISLLCKIPVRNDVAMTGEIDLNGSIHCIGGLDLKIDGGKCAGAKLILCPEQNKQDLEIIAKETPEILENIEIKTISNIWEIIEIALVENDIEFNKYI